MAELQISAHVYLNSKNFQILLLVVSSDFANFSLLTLFMLLSLPSNHKSLVISVVCIIENGPLALGFHLALGFDVFRRGANSCC